jgi:hypothetical protein
MIAMSAGQFPADREGERTVNRLSERCYRRISGSGYCVTSVTRQRTQATGDKSHDHGDRIGSPLDRLASVVLEVDPPFIETVEHSHAGFWTPHALRAKQPIL